MRNSNCIIRNNLTVLNMALVVFLFSVGAAACPQESASQGRDENIADHGKQSVPRPDPKNLPTLRTPTILLKGSTLISSPFDRVSRIASQEDKDDGIKKVVFQQLEEFDRQSNLSNQISRLQLSAPGGDFAPKVENLPPNLAINAGSRQSSQVSHPQGQRPLAEPIRDPKSEDLDGVYQGSDSRSVEELPEPAEFDNSYSDESVSGDLLLQSARNALRNNDFSNAVNRFLGYLKQNPADDVVRFELAGTLVQAGRFPAAASQYEHLRAQSPGNFQYLRAFADLYLTQSNFVGAEPLLQQLVQNHDYQGKAAIELARIYAATQRKQQAIAIYEQILQFQFPDSLEDKMRLAQLLNEINLPSRAMEVLIGLEALQPMNAELVKQMIIASARLGDLPSSLQYVERLQNIQPEDINLRDQLAQQLHDEGFHQAALQLDQQILVFAPEHREALIRTAAAHLKMYDTQSAFSVLQGRADFRNDPQFLIVLGEYHSLRGEHADAIASYRRVLAKNSGDAKARIGFGHAYMRIGQYRRAIAEFSKVNGCNDPCALDGSQRQLSAELAKARGLARLGLYCDAVEVVQCVYGGCELANRDQIIDASLDVLSISKEYTLGIEMARQALNDAAGRPIREAALRSKLGLLLVRAGKFSEGLNEFEALDIHSGQVTPEQVYGMYRAHSQLGNGAGAREVLFQHLGLLANDVYLRVRVAELATEDCDCCLAREVLMNLHRLCGTNVMVGNRLGEACLLCTDCQSAGNCTEYFCEVLKSSPANVQAMLGLARMNSCLLYTSPSPRDRQKSRMPSSA